MNENIIKFYLSANELKNVIRTGWKEVGIPSEKVESVADHVYGSLVLALGILSEKDYSGLDILKVFKMLIVKELCKVKTSEQSVVTGQDSKDTNKEALLAITSSLKGQSELMEIYEEAVALTTPEAKFVQHVSKLESDIQAKKYELDGLFTLENAKRDIEAYPTDLKEEILPQVNKPSDGWILFDRRYYSDDENFISLSKDIQDL